MLHWTRSTWGVDPYHGFRVFAAASVYISLSSLAPFLLLPPHPLRRPIQHRPLRGDAEGEVEERGQLVGLGQEDLRSVPVGGADAFGLFAEVLHHEVAAVGKGLRVNATEMVEPTLPDEAKGDGGYARQSRHPYGEPMLVAEVD